MFNSLPISNVLSVLSLETIFFFKPGVITDRSLQLAKFECSLACCSVKTNHTALLTPRCANYLGTGILFEISLIFRDNMVCV